MIAVTGANGLLGSFIVRQLVELQQPFVAIKRQNSDTSLLNDLADKITWRNADVLDPVSLDDAFQGITHVIHAAALVSFNPSRAKKIYDINVIGTRNVVNACLANNIMRFVHISSVAALGRQKGQKLIDENNKWLESTVNSTYAESKYLAELEVFRAQEEGLNTIIINPSVILAPADWKKSSAQLFKYIWDQRPYYINGNLNYVDARDVANVAVKFLDSPITAERFILNAASIPFQDFFKLAADKMNKKAPWIRLNNTFLHVVAAVETLRSKLTQSEPLITPETARLSGTFFSYSSQKIKNTLNFDFKSIDNTLSWCCGYYLNYIDKK
jgi:nucleoside-diphosphate-sugar epimerase